MMGEIIHIAYAKGFRFKGVTLEWNDYLGPTILNRHTEEERHYKNISLRIWNLVDKFSCLSKDEREQYRIY